MVQQVERVPVDAPRRGARGRSPLERYLGRLHHEISLVDAGEVASYIPELAAVAPDTFGICLATPGGTLYEAGDTAHPFTLQSISKPLTYGLALQDAGLDAVRATIGVEPSGEAFNAISLDTESGRPLNPMINAGAIATVSLVREPRPGLSRADRILGAYSVYAGRTLAVDEDVYRSERATGHRNRAIAHLLRAGDVVGDAVEETVDAYFRQCAVEVDCRDLAVIGATLANGGVNPVTGRRALDASFVRHVLSVMTTCGMYDGAGEWLFSVGLPAKSGVSGGVLAVLPGRLGIAVFSPRVDPRGNSVRGVRACMTVARDFDVHLLDGGRPAVQPIRASYTLADVASRRVRVAEEREVLDRLGRRCRVIEVQGELELSAYERVSAAALDWSGDGAVVVLDLTRVTRVEPGLEALVADLVEELGRAGARLAVVGSGVAAFVGRADADLLPGGLWLADDLDTALERCEELILTDGGMPSTLRSVAIADHPLVARVPAGARDAILDALVPRRLVPGEALVRIGEAPDALYLVTAGRLSVVRPDGTRAATLSAGTVVGELGAVDGRERSADVVADTAALCHALPWAALEALGAEHPAAHAAVLGVLLEELTRTVRRLERELSIVGPRASR